MHTIKIDDQNYFLKSKFSEMDRKEFLKICYLRSKNMSATEMNEVEFHAIRIAMFTALSNVPMPIIETINARQWVDILKYVNFCFKAPDFEKNPIPELNLKGVRYVGPTGLLDKSTIEEMAQADTVFTQASNMKDQDRLFLLVSILYRPIRWDLKTFEASDNWNGDIREPFNLEKCKERADKFKKLPTYYIVAVFLYYWSFRENKLMKFGRIFKSSTKSNNKKDRGWAGTLLEMSHLPVFGNLDQTSKQNWFTVLFEMDRQMEIQEKREEELDRIRNK
jgi:hypothetical protein